MGKAGQVYHVRFNLEARCEVRDETSNQVSEIFLGAPCRTEYTIARRNLFHVPSDEFRMAFSRTASVRIARRPVCEAEATSTTKLSEMFQDHRIDIRSFDDATELKDAGSIVEATLANDLLNAQSTYRNDEHRLTVTIEYPINLINVNADDGEFQVCTGPVILPDLATRNGTEVSRVFLAHAAFSQPDHVEFILRREVEASPEERVWLDKPRGRDRLELIDPDNPPPNYPPPRPRPKVYNETWELAAHNMVLRAANV